MALEELCLLLAAGHLSLEGADLLHEDPLLLVQDSLEHDYRRARGHGARGLLLSLSVLEGRGGSVVDEEGGGREGLDGGVGGGARALRDGESGGGLAVRRDL